MMMMMMISELERLGCCSASKALLTVGLTSGVARSVNWGPQFLSILSFFPV